VSRLAQRADTFRALRPEIEAPLGRRQRLHRRSARVRAAGADRGLATDFGLAEALVAGKIASHPAVMRFGSRVASEGGGDVDAGWARPA
jgi:hypothetical protein